MVEPLFQKMITCDFCNKQFQTSKVRSSVIRVSHTDSDFCSHYKGMNPNFYDVRVCPKCGNATTEKFSIPFNYGTKIAFEEKIGRNWKPRDFGGERTSDDALQCMKLALLNAQLRGERDVIVAQLCHHIAWMFRFADNQEDEKRFIGFALKNYMQAFVNERSDFNLAKLKYLIGELHARLGDSNEAIRWFGKVVNDRTVTDQGIIQMARDRWADLRTPGNSANEKPVDE